MNKYKLQMFIGGVLILLAVLLYFYYGVLQKDSRDIYSEAPVHAVTASALIEEYKADIRNADLKYLNKTIEVTGYVYDRQDSVVTLDASVLCNFDKKITETVSNVKTTIKGRCMGYDELFGEIKLDQCIIKNYKP